jgi:glycerol-3-phosphate dehydrogenase (NAD(P)+)
MIEVEGQQHIANHAHTSTAGHRLGEVPPKRAGAVRRAERRGRREGHDVRAVGVPVGHEGDGSCGGERPEPCGAGQISVRNHDVLVTFVGEATHRMIDSRVESLADLPEHRGASRPGPRRDHLVVTHHVGRVLATCAEHTIGGPASQPFALLHRQRRIESLLRGTEPLDRHEDGGLHPAIVRSDPTGAACVYDQAVTVTKAIQVGVVGAGTWGTTMAALISANTPTILWARRATLAQQIDETHINGDYLAEFELPVGLRATNDMECAVGAADVVVMAVPSHGYRDAAREVFRHIPPGVPVVSLTKGLERETSKRMSEVTAEEIPEHPVAVLTGPNLAREILAGQPAASVIAIADEVIAAELQRLFGRPSLRIYTNPDIVGSELAGVVKNVIAIAAGMAEGMGFGDNTRATLITRGLSEMARLGVALGAQRGTFAGMAGMGDLIATCSSRQSRNNMVGLQLGQGRSIADIVAGTNMVAEGVNSCTSVLALARRYGVEMPITEQVVAVCHHGATPAAALAAVMQRKRRSELP